MTLEPGDIVATGTPSGVGGAREPRVWLADGDEIVVSSPTLGRAARPDRSLSGAGQVRAFTVQGRRTTSRKRPPPGRPA